MSRGEPPDAGASDRETLLKLWSSAQKILSQELRTGCSDRTVLGGLERFVSNWSSSIFSSEASSHTWPEARRLVDLLGGYGQRSPEARREAARAALAIAGDVAARLRALSPGATSTGSSAMAPQPSMPSAHGPAEAPSGGARPSRRAEGQERPAISRGGRRAETTAAGTEARRSLSRPRRSPPGARRPSAGLEDPVLILRGVGKLKASKLARLGIEKVRDLLAHYPRDYRDYRLVKRIADLMYGETASVLGTVEDVQVVPGPRGRVRITARVRDESGRVSATWFRHGYGGIRMAPNSRVALAGTVSGYGNQIVFESPDWELAERPPLHTRRLVPVYPLTEGVSDYWMRELMAEVVPALAPQLEEFLPAWMVRRFGLMPLSQAVARLHLPSDPEELAEARRRLAFDELFLVQVAALKSRAEWRAGATAPELSLDDAVVERFLAHLPFSPTAAQRRVIAEILGDMAQSLPMTRLLQGDVGSGKTVVAAVALLAAAAGGVQGAIMAPTEILAEQHARTLRAIYEGARGLLMDLLGRPLRLDLLTSASRRPEREATYRDVMSGEVDILVGTHAIIQEGLEFRRLGLAVIDEQHRFGVGQRASLRQKGGTPHLLVMTATPIPRTLALALYGDLDLSIIDEMPPGRQRVKTYLLGPGERAHAYEHIRREVAKGRQAFIICPLVEDSPHLEVRAATAEYDRLRQGELSGLKLALLHGRMRPAEKDQIMLDFRNGLYDVLVSTSVVEVGIDVPNATVMLVEGAERFGLAQLHQFRGRVGRGEHKSCCILLTDSREEAAQERLQTLVSVDDGFRLADEDLRMRGPGEYFGVRQSGFPEFRVADLQDVTLIQVARKAATELLDLDPDLSESQHGAVAARVAELRRAVNS